MLKTRKNYEHICWWCESTANTKEHIIKKTDFEIVFGKNIQKSEPVLININNWLKMPLLIRSSNSKLLKYHRKNLCSDCNNSKSQEMDLAYEEFIRYLIENDKEVYQNGIDYRNIFNKNWKQKK